MLYQRLLSISLNRVPCLTCKQRNCVNSSKDLWPIKKNKKEYKILNSDNSICWTVEEIWLRVWETGITHMVFYVRGRHWSCWCWLLLINADSWWLLLVAAGCWMIAGCGWDTAVCWKIAACGWDTAGCWMIAGCGWDILAGEKVFEYFQDTDDLRLRQFCRRNSLWIFSGFWWYAAKTILQAKKSLSFSRIMMICG